MASSDERERRMSSKNSLSRLSRFAGVLCTLALAVSLLAAGFAACCMPQTTRVFSEATSNFESSPYAHDQLVELAVATRDYTVDGISREALYAQVVEAGRESATDAALGKADSWHPIAEQVNLLDISLDDTTIAKRLATDVRYCLDEDALTHLDACYELISKAIPLLWGVAAIAFLLVIVLSTKKCWRDLSRALIIAPLLLLVFLGACGVMALISWDNFFALFHGLFFPQGGWIFPWYSLLICMYPEAFWTHMALLWLGTTGALSLASFIFGVVIRRRTTTPRGVHSIRR